MAEEAVATETTESTETTETTSWLDEHDFSDDDKKALAKYTTRDDALKGGLEAIHKVGKSVRFPDDKTSDEDKASFDSKVATYRGVPEKPEDYQLDRTKTSKEVPYDENLEKWFRGKMHEAGASQKTAEAVYNSWTEMQLEGHKAAEKVATEGEKALREKYSEDFEVKFGKPGDKENIGTIKQTLLQLSNMLKMDYKDNEGNPQSRLLDSLEITRIGGRFGDKPELAEVFDWLHQNFFAEGKTFAGQGLQKGEAVSEDFFDYNDMDKEESHEI